MTNISRLKCREIADDSARHLRNLREGNPFAVVALPRTIAKLEAAYLSPNCEDTTSMRIRANLDLIEEFAGK